MEMEGRCLQRRRGGEGIILVGFHGERGVLGDGNRGFCDILLKLEEEEEAGGAGERSL